MDLDNLTHTSGEWLRGTGPESDIVISSRIRLARNVAAFPFTNRASAYQKAEIEGMLRDRVARLELDPRLEYLNVPNLSPLDRQFPRTNECAWCHQPTGSRCWMLTIRPITPESMSSFRRRVYAV